MRNVLCLAALAAFAAVGGEASSALPRRVAEFEFAHAAVASFHDDFPGSEGPALVVTSFYPFGSDKIIVVPSAAEVLAGGAPNVSVVDANAAWPNQADPVPSGAIASAPAGSKYILSASGFFVSPSKSTGSVTLLDVTNFPAVRQTVLSTPRAKNFYHEATWLDVNGDGLLDIVAARAFKPMIFGQPEGDLVWLEQPATKASSQPWVERQITNTTGPGVAFCVTQLSGDGQSQIVAAQYFAAQQLSIWWCESPHWSGCENGTNVGSAVIDSSEDSPYFNVEWVDLNGDGKKELLATTNEANGKGSVLAYEVPDNFRSGTWKKHRLASGYKPKQAYLPGRGSPGTARAFFPHKGDERPSILVSADDGGWVDLLTPTDQDFVYTKQRVVNSTNTVGTMAIGDVNGDGYSDFAVPLFAENKVALYTFGPAK